jgi:DNA-binding GntR family transcriptional regulator
MSTRINDNLDSRQAIPRQTLTSAVAGRLRDKILRGQFREGEQLRQHAIAEEFAVSRIPLREAFRQLEAEGLIKIIDHRGAVVATLTPDEIEELFEIRAALESVTLRRAVPMLTDDDLELAEKVLRKYEQALNDESDFDVWGELHWQFHSTLYAAARRTRSTHHAGRSGDERVHQGAAPAILIACRPAMPAAIRSLLLNLFNSP